MAAPARVPKTVHPEHGGDGGEEVRARHPAVLAAEAPGVGVVELHEGAHVDELDDGGDDDGGERGLGQILEEPGEEEQRDDGQGRRKQPRSLRARTGRRVDGRLGEAAADHHAAGHPGGEVGAPEGHQLAVGVESCPASRRPSPPPAPPRTRSASRRSRRRPVGRRHRARCRARPSDGRPLAIDPTVGTSRPKALAAAIAPTTATSGPGTRGASRRRPKITASEHAPTSNVRPCVSPRWVTRCQACSKKSPVPPLIPNSFGSCPTMIVSARPMTSP